MDPPPSTPDNARPETFAPSVQNSWRRLWSVDSSVGCFQVRINLGAGEGEVTSPPDRRLDDLLWHDVQVQRNNADLALTIDGVHITR